MVSLPKNVCVPIFVGGQLMTAMETAINRQPIGPKHVNFSGWFLPRIGGKVKEQHCFAGFHSPLLFLLT